MNLDPVEILVCIGEGYSSAVAGENDRRDRSSAVSVARSFVVLVVRRVRRKSALPLPADVRFSVTIGRDLRDANFLFFAGPPRSAESISSTIRGKGVVPFAGATVRENAEICETLPVVATVDVLRLRNAAMQAIRRGNLRSLLLRFASPDVANVFRVQASGAEIFPLDRLVHLLPVDGDFGRSIDSETNFVAADIDDRDDDVVTDDDALVTLSRQHKHPTAPSEIDGPRSGVS